MARVEITRGQGHNLHTVPIAVSSGTTELVAAQPGLVISVVSYVIVASGAGTAKFSDGADLTGAMALAANGGVAANGQASSPWFWTGAGSALSIITTATVNGHLTYTY
jgi:hypothetical protein